MAYAQVHPIKATLGKAIDYICNKNKTENGKWISSYNCQYQIAEHEFEFTRKEMNDRIELLAFHAIQSFQKGEVTPEQAYEIGMETMKRMLDGQYEFVIATHVDKACIHNHIIINEDSVFRQEREHHENYDEKKKNDIQIQIFTATNIEKA